MKKQTTYCQNNNNSVQQHWQLWAGLEIFEWGGQTGAHTPRVSQMEN